MSVIDPLLDESNSAYEEGYDKAAGDSEKTFASIKSEFLSHFPAATPEHPELIIFDTDIGDFSDDCFALLLALNSPEITVLGITTVYGNVEQRGRIALHIANLFGAHGKGKPAIPVYAGEAQPMQPSPRFANGNADCRQWSASLDGTTPKVGEGAVDFIIKTVSENPGKVTLFVIGPMTNVGVALKKRPQLEKELKRVVIMGGTFFKQYAEYNLEVDAAATDLLLAADVEKWAVGLDVTLLCRHPVSHLEALRTCPHPAQQFVSALLTADKLDHAHDPLAVAAMIRPDILTFVKGRAVQTQPGVIAFTLLQSSASSSSGGGGGGSSGSSGDDGSNGNNRNVLFAANSVQAQLFLDFFKERAFPA